MKLLLAACLLGLVSAQPTYEPVTRYYHESHGIQQAARIKAAEEAKDFDGSRILGGAVTALGQFPFMAGLVITLTNSLTSVCGATLVSNTRVLTAASCWWDGRSQARSMVVVLGSVTLFTGGTRLPVNNANVIIHPNYNFLNLRNNVALLVVSRITYSTNIRNIPLATGDSNFAGVTGTIVGFGRNGDSVPIPTNQVLRHTTRSVITNPVCQNTYGPDLVVESNICTTGTINFNVCYGDTGGPLALTVNGVLVLAGVSSFVAAAGCERGLPAGFSRVTWFRTWIISNW